MEKVYQFTYEDHLALTDSEIADRITTIMNDDEYLQFYCSPKYFKIAKVKVLSDAHKEYDVEIYGTYHL